MFVIIAHSPRAVCDNGDMCGIAGFVAAGQGDAAFKAVGAMVGALRRRGPDQERIEIWPDAVLGHRRLAILDLSPAGDQPMLSEDGQIGLVFNGCIYNFLDLRKELEGYGHAFRSQCARTYCRPARPMSRSFGRSPARRRRDSTMAGTSPGGT